MVCILCENLIRLEGSHFKCDDCQEGLRDDQKEIYIDRLLRFSIGGKKYQHYLNFRKNEGYYRPGWIKFVRDVMNSRKPEFIKELSFLYFKGYGVKKSSDLGEIIFLQAVEIEKKSEKDPIFPCPICLENEDCDGNYNICCTCGNMICGYCNYKLRTGICPICRSNQLRSHFEKMIDLNNLLRKKEDERSKNHIKLFLATLHIFGENNVKNYERSKELLANIISKYVWKGLHLYGIIYREGYGVEKDLKKSFNAFYVGSKKKDLLCMKELADCYRYGKGVKKNRKKAIQYLTKAAIDGNIDSFLILDEWRPKINRVLC